MPVLTQFSASIDIIGLYQNPKFQTNNIKNFLLRTDHINSTIYATREMKF